MCPCPLRMSSFFTLRLFQKEMLKIEVLRCTNLTVMVKTAAPQCPENNSLGVWTSPEKATTFSLGFNHLPVGINARILTFCVLQDVLVSEDHVQALEAAQVTESTQTENSFRKKCSFIREKLLVSVRIALGLAQQIKLSWWQPTVHTGTDSVWIQQGRCVRFSCVNLYVMWRGGRISLRKQQLLWSANRSRKEEGLRPRQWCQQDSIAPRATSDWNVDCWWIPFPCFRWSQMFGLASANWRARIDAWCLNCLMQPLSNASHQKCSQAFFLFFAYLIIKVKTCRNSANF